MKNLSTTRKGGSKRKIVSLIVVMLTAFIVAFITLLIQIDRFFDTYDLTFRTPVIVQSPMKLEKRKTVIIKPISMINKVYADEIKNPYDAKSPKGIAWEKIKTKWNIGEWTSFEELVRNESGWNPYSRNGSSGACGLGQAMPCSKMDCESWDYECQVDWTINYVANRYKTPSKALAHWNARVPINGKDVGNWY